MAMEELCRRNAFEASDAANRGLVPARVAERLKKTAQSGAFVGVNVEDRIKLRELEEIVNFL
jgi:hypothetical protein